MKVFGIDFTSAPRRGKPITCLSCTLRNGVLKAERLVNFASFDRFEAALRTSGPWIAGIDFPFGQSRKFITTMGWPLGWADYVNYAGGLGREPFRAALDGYRAARPRGDKEHRRATDIAAGAISPQKIHGVPVGMMFFEGARRLLEAGVTIPHLQRGDPTRFVVEAYPGVLARRLIGRRSYKNDSKSRQTDQLFAARHDLLKRIMAGACLADYGSTIEAPVSLADDPSGDSLDALLCAIQAAWSWRQRHNGFGAPSNVDPLEGWIADPYAARPVC